MVEFLKSLIMKFLGEGNYNNITLSKVELTAKEMLQNITELQEKQNLSDKVQEQ